MEETLGKRIVAHRKKMGLTQEQLAEKLGVTAQAVSKWENDLSCPDINMLPQLAALFGTTTDELLGHEKVYEAEVITQEESKDEAEKDSGWEFHWDGGRKGALSFAIFVLLVGGLLMAARALDWDVGFWSIAWPSGLLVFGLAALLHRFNFTNLVCSLLGAYFLIDNLGVFSISLDKGLIFPGLILIFGLSLLIDALRKPKKGRFHINKKGSIDHKTRTQFHQDGEYFEASLSFGEANHRVSLPRLSEGEASVSFGSLELDLTDCGEIADGCDMDISVSFGSLELRIPRQYRVQCSAGASFGEVSTHGHPDSDAKGTIELDGSVSFGELEIHYV